MGRTAVKLNAPTGDAARPQAAPSPASQTRRIDSYEIRQCLGSGGMGTVYKAHDDKLDRIVALKVMLKDLRADPSILEAFRKEARAVAKLNHPNIAQIYSFGESDGKPYIVMEYVAGEHFDNLVFSPAPLDQTKVMKTGMEIAGGLQVAADAGLVHGDIKPENIVFDDHGVPKLLDFGIASASNAKSTEVWGTPYYIAPEKLRRQRVDFRSDIYCLGATLYHALTKHPPFDGDDVRKVLRARLEGPPPPMSSYRPDIDPEVEAIIGRMLQADPADRYPTYGALIADIRAYLRRVAPRAVQMEGIFVEDGAPRKKPRTPFFQDIKSQIMLLLVLIAMFPYIVFFYVKPSLFPRGYQPPPYAAEMQRREAEDRKNLEASDQTEAAADTQENPSDNSDDRGEERPEDQEPLGDPNSPESSKASNSPANPPPQTEKLEAPEKPAASAVADAPAPKAVETPPSPPEDKVVDVTVATQEAPPVEWPPLKVTAILGGGKNGGALVNGEILSVGFSLPSGVTLRAVEPQSATFEYEGETKRIFVSKPRRPAGDGKKH